MSTNTDKLFIWLVLIICIEYLLKLLFLVYHCKIHDFIQDQNILINVQTKRQIIENHIKINYVFVIEVLLVILKHTYIIIENSLTIRQKLMFDIILLFLIVQFYLDFRYHLRIYYRFFIAGCQIIEVKQYDGIFSNILIHLSNINLTTTYSRSSLFDSY